MNEEKQNTTNKEIDIYELNTKAIEVMKTITLPLNPNEYWFWMFGFNKEKPGVLGCYGDGSTLELLKKYDIDAHKDIISNCEVLILSKVQYRCVNGIGTPIDKEPKIEIAEVLLNVSTDRAIGIMNEYLKGVSHEVENSL